MREISFINITTLNFGIFLDFPKKYIALIKNSNANITKFCGSLI